MQSAPSTLSAQYKPRVNTENAAFVKRTLILAVLFGLMQGGQSFGQDTAGVIFHVTSVRSDDAKDIEVKCENKCSAIRLIVEGFINAKDGSGSIEYVLECHEITTYVPSAHLVVECDRVHSHTDYLVKVLSDAIVFGPERDSSSTPSHSAYMIKSEKEVTKQKAK